MTCLRIRHIKVLFIPSERIHKMLFSIFLLFVSLYVRASLGGTLSVVDYDGQCVIWSEDNHGCTGSSAALGLRDGDDCSGAYKHNYTILRC